MARFTVYEDETATSPVQVDSSSQDDSVHAATYPAAHINAATSHILTTPAGTTPVSSTQTTSTQSTASPSTTSDVTFSVPVHTEEVPATFDSLPHDICTLVMKNVLPTYLSLNPSHPADEPIPITTTRVYFLATQAYFVVSTKMRAAARQACAEINNFGAYLSQHSQNDWTTVMTLGGLDILKTTMIDVEVNKKLQPATLAAIMANASNTEHLYLVVSAMSRTPGLYVWWEDEEEEHDFVLDYGEGFMDAFRKLKTIDIDLASESSVSTIAPIVGTFLFEAWMGRTRRDELPLLVLLRRALRHHRPAVTINAATDSQRYSDDPFW